MNARLASFGLVLLAACATTNPAGSRREVGDLVAERTGVREAIEPEQDAESRARVRERVDALLARPLTMEGAVQVALLNNRAFQATLEGLGVAQADLVQAGLLENPVIAGDLVVSTRGNGLGGGVSLSQSLLSVFLIPAKRRLAKAELRNAVLTVGHAALELVRDVRVAYVTVQAAIASRDLHRELVQLAEIADELAERQVEAGNLPALDRSLFAGALDEARVQLADAELQVVAAREALSRLMGLWGAQIEWMLAAGLQDPPAADLTLANLEQHALRERLDVSAARFEVESIELALALRRRGIVPQLEGGVESRNEVGDDAGHEWVIGPSLAIELPIFDPGHADFARIRAHLRAAQYRLQQLAIDTRSDVRLHRAEVVAARRKVDYYVRTVIPRREAITELTLEQYNAMLLGTYQLLETRAELTEARRAHVEALRDLWISYADLELAVGGRLPVGE